MTEANDPKSSADVLPDGKEYPLKIGDRVRLSALGKIRSPRTISMGRVEKIASFKKGAGTVWVLLDGCRTATRLHSSYLELEK